MFMTPLNPLWSESSTGWYTEAMKIFKAPQYCLPDLALFGDINSMLMNLPQKFESGRVVEKGYSPDFSTLVLVLVK